MWFWTCGFQCHTPEVRKNCFIEKVTNKMVNKSLLDRTREGFPALEIEVRRLNEPDLLSQLGSVGVAGVQLAGLERAMTS